MPKQVKTISAIATIDNSSHATDSKTLFGHCITKFPPSNYLYHHIYE
jgi:hypothetical protein